jgi:hypothetical protein
MVTMTRNLHLATLFTTLFIATVQAQAPSPGCRFHWQTGQTLTYRTKQTIAVTEVADGKKVETSTALEHVKRWQVLAVDPAGVATLQMTLAHLRNETKTPSGEVFFFDSNDLDKSNPDMREQMIKYVGIPLVVLRVDARGRVVEVKESKHGSPTRYESELPFAITLPDSGVLPGQSWERHYKITLEPPHGANDKYDSVQKYTCKNVANGMATIHLTTTLARLPEAPADQIPLVQAQPQGEVVFDMTRGRIQLVKLDVDRELKDHAGEGSSFRFQASIREELLP